MFVITYTKKNLLGFIDYNKAITCTAYSVEACREAINRINRENKRNVIISLTDANGNNVRF